MPLPQYVEWRGNRLWYRRAYAETIADVRAGGANSLPTIAAELNARGIVTARGGKWHPSSVRNLLARLERA